jgi:hypothetical protein
MALAAVEPSTTVPSVVRIRTHSEAAGRRVERRRGTAKRRRRCRAKGRASGCMAAWIRQDARGGEEKSGEEVERERGRAPLFTRR